MDSFNTTALLASVTDAAPWLERFARTTYAGAFREYRDTYSPVWSEAVRSAGEAGLPGLAGAFLNAMAAAWTQQPFWRRSGMKFNIQQMLVCYLSPMLLEAGEEPARLAALLRDGWAERWPKNAYRIATQKKLQGGFHLTILGIPLPERQQEDSD